MGVCVFTWVQIYMLVEQRDHKCVALVWDICLNSSSLAIYENYSHIIENHKFTWLIHEICFVMICVCWECRAQNGDGRHKHRHKQIWFFLAKWLSLKNWTLSLANCAVSFAIFMITLAIVAWQLTLRIIITFMPIKQRVSVWICC